MAMKNREAMTFRKKFAISPEGTSRDLLGRFPKELVKKEDQAPEGRQVCSVCRLPVAPPVIVGN